ncbi:hypothetical protein Tco_1358929 [Tanacetum coccineum]
MTRSSTKDLLTPFKEPEQVLHSSRKLFKTLSLNYSSSPEFDLFFDCEDRSEEEVAEVMTEPTMEEYMTDPRTLWIGGADNEDANEHIEKVLEIVDLFHILEEVILFYKGLDVHTRQILDFKDVMPSMKATDAKKDIQDMAYC